MRVIQKTTRLNLDFNASRKMPSAKYRSKKMGVCFRNITQDTFGWHEKKTRHGKQRFYGNLNTEKTVSMAKKSSYIRNNLLLRIYVRRALAEKTKRIRIPISILKHFKSGIITEWRGACTDWHFPRQRSSGVEFRRNRVHFAKLFRAFSPAIIHAQSMPARHNNIIVTCTMRLIDTMAV